MSASAWASHALCPAVTMAVLASLAPAPPLTSFPLVTLLTPRTLCACSRTRAR